VVRITKSIAETRLGEVPQGEQFWCEDGRVLNNLPELSVALHQMHAETYRHHAGGNRNDFSNWVRDVIGDDKLSRDLLKSTSQAQSAKSVGDRIAWLKSKLEV